jgi:hypothetical protein
MLTACGCCLAEVQLYRPTRETLIPATELTVITSSSDDAFPAANCFDGNTDNHCQSTVTDTSVVRMYVVYPCSRALKRVIVHNRAISGGDEPARINVFTMDVVAANGTVTFKYPFEGGMTKYDIPVVPVSPNPSW